jgi:hypothetical protein
MTGADGSITGRHRRADQDVPASIQRHEALVIAVRIHVPGARSSLCLRCGTPWPCPDLFATLGSRTAGDVEWDQPPELPVRVATPIPPPARPPEVQHDLDVLRRVAQGLTALD